MTKRWELDEVFERFSDQFDHYLSRLAQRQRQGVPNDSPWPAMDIFETRDAFKIIMEIPGVEKENVNLNVVDDDLIIEGNKEIPCPDEECNYHQIERTYGPFKRLINLPENINIQAISAHYEHGVLTVVIPKSEATCPHTKIKIS